MEVTMRRMTKSRWKKIHRRAMKKGVMKTVKYLRQEMDRRIEEIIANGIPSEN